MIYLDNAATTLRKAPGVGEAMVRALAVCGNPGRSGHRAAVLAEQAMFLVRTLAGVMFDCPAERVCFTMNATHGLNIALRSLVHSGDRVVISGLEHNAVTRTLSALGAITEPVRAPLFDTRAWQEGFAAALRKRPAAVVMVHVSNVFGCVLPIEEIGALCSRSEVPLVVDASQSAGILPVSMEKSHAAYIAMPGHKGLLGPQGTGLLLCGGTPAPLLLGGTGSQSLLQQMPAELPDRLEVGTPNLPGICGLGKALEWLQSREFPSGTELRLTRALSQGLSGLGAEVWAGPGQCGVVSFRLPEIDPEEAALRYADQGIALRAGLHCAPLAHESGGTLPDGTIRASVSRMTKDREVETFLRKTKMLFF